MLNGSHHQQVFDGRTIQSPTCRGPCFGCDAHVGPGRACRASRACRACRPYRRPCLCPYPFQRLAACGHSWSCSSKHDFTNGNGGFTSTDHRCIEQTQGFKHRQLGFNTGTHCRMCMRQGDICLGVQIVLK